MWPSPTPVWLSPRAWGWSSGMGWTSSGSRPRRRCDGGGDRQRAGRAGGRGGGRRRLPGAGPPLEAGREAAAPPEPGYTVQVVAYWARPAADEMEQKLREAGFDAYVAPISSGDDGRTPSRVRVGRL